MFTESNRIVLIDDDLADLNQLSQIFISDGIGCKTFLYDTFYNNPLIGVRFLFLDINLNAAQTDQQRGATVRDTLIHYIHENNGPFVLIFWTTNIEWVDNIKEHINRNVDEEILKRNPVYITNIDKSEFINKDSELKEKVKNIFATPLVSALFDFEERMSSAINQTMSQIIEIIPKGNSWGDNETFNQNAQKVFSSIAVQTLGYKNAKTNPDVAIKEAMVPIFNHMFMNDSVLLWKNVLKNLENSNQQNEITFPDEFNVAKLNHLFHINANGISKDTRGAICPILLDTGDNGGFFKKFGCKYLDWFGFSFPDVSKEERNISQLICVEFSAACDYSQRKRRTNKYLLGEILPISTLEKLLNSDKKGDYLLLIPYKFEINQEEKIIAFNLNFSFTVDFSQKDQTLGEPLFCLKKEIMDLIGNKYAYHVSRIGVTSFR